MHPITICPGQREGSYSSSIKGLVLPPDLKGVKQMSSLHHKLISSYAQTQTSLNAANSFPSPSQIQILSLISVTVVPPSSFLTSCLPALSVSACLNIPMPVPRHFTLPAYHPPHLWHPRILLSFPHTHILWCSHTDTQTRTAQSDL